MNIHLTAIAGTGMAQLAGLLSEAGHEVRGSDLEIWPPMSFMLEEMRIPVMKGFKPENLNWRPDLVVIGNVCRRDNAEAVEADNRGIRKTSFPAALYEFFLSKRHSVVVAGTHGKTTTTALTAWILEHAGLCPSFLVGGVPLNFDRGFRMGKGEHFVVEGDEYDTAFFDKGPKFLHYSPRTALVTSVEFDHADIYRDLAHIEEAFGKFTAIVPEDGLVIACAEGGSALKVTAQAKAKVKTYGMSGEQDYTASIVRAGENGTEFAVAVRGEPQQSFLLPLWGRHNVLNACAAVAVCRSLGLDHTRIREGIAGFKGVRRRQELVGEAGGVRIIDDFAHHPTAVRETISSVRQRFPKSRLWGVFEPRSATSCRKIFGEEFVAALSMADVAILAANFRSSQLPDAERLDPQEIVAGIVKAGRDARFIAEAPAIVDFLAAETRPGDVVLVMSNGSFGGIVGRLKKALKHQS